VLLRVNLWQKKKKKNLNDWENRENCDIIVNVILNRKSPINSGVKGRMFRIKGFKSFPLKTLNNRKIYTGGKDEEDFP